MKKYPFSSKAVKAMIAATVAFTPIATTAIVFDANKVEAAHVQDSAHFTSVTAFEKYALEVRNDSNTSDEVADALDSLNWTAAVNPVFDTSASNEQKAAVAALLELQTSIYTGTYEKGDLRTFIDDHKQYLGNLPDKDYITYLGVVEELVYDEISTIADEDENYTHAIFNSIVNAVKEADHEGIRQHVSDVLVITDVKMKDVVSNIETHFAANDVTRGELKLAMMFAGAAWLSNYGAPHGGGGGGGGTTDPEPEPGNPGDPGTVTPGTGGNVTVSPEIEENGTQITATIPSDLQTRIIEGIRAQTTEITIQLPDGEPGQTVSLDIPAPLVDAIEAKAPNATIVVVGDGATYYLPVEEIDTAAIAADLGTTVAELSFRVSINPVPSAQAIQITQLLQSRGANVVASIVDITLEAVVGDKVYPIKSLGNVYVERAFGLNKTVNTNRTTGAVLENDGTYRALPTKFKTVNGKQQAVVSSLTNSIYTVVESDITFPDVNNGKNWAEDYIETLASKYIISGTTAGTYKGDEYMTRAQFAMLLSRALGLPSEKYDNRFKDVKGDEWFNANGALMSAVKHGIIAGKKDGTFAPNDRITRAEAAAMIGRALNLKMIKFDTAKLNKNKKLADFKDAKAIGASTREEVLKVYQAGIMAGTTAGTFQPNEFTKRDQMARILAEFLIKAELMEDIKK